MESGNRQLKILVDARLASAFKATCRESGVSMARELSGYMQGFVGAAEKTMRMGRFRTTTRKDRRGMVRTIVTMLTAARDAEEAYMGRIPDSLKGAPAHEAAEFAVDAMDEAIELLNGAYG